MSIYDIGVKTIDGEDTTLAEYKGKAMLVVNVASKCGFTPQYGGLRELQDRFRDKGLIVLGFPCNQFGNQEPGSEQEIAEFCSLTYDVNFPMFSKVDVNGDSRHPLYEELTRAPDADGNAGDVKWNFEKFLISPEGEVAVRFRTQVKPTADEVVEAVESQLP